MIIFLGEDAKTLYGSVGYSFGKLGLTALYGTTDFVGGKEAEFNLVADYEINKDLTASLVYVNYNDKIGNGDYNKVYSSLTYSF